MGGEWREMYSSIKTREKIVRFLKRMIRQVRRSERRKALSKAVENTVPVPKGTDTGRSAGDSDFTLH